MATTYYVAWWNVENLFDEKDSPRRSERLRKALGKDLEDWTADRRDRKIAQLAKTVAAMNDDQGPDLLGVCEIENAWVLERLRDSVAAQLPDRRYAVAHADTSDHRGIDVAFVYDERLFTAPPDQRFQHVVMRRTATRELFQVNFQTHRGRTWTVFANHWPSRSGGQLESAGYRAIAGETLSYFHQRALEVHGKTTPVLAMGDFNDEPFDPSLTLHALGTRERITVVRRPDKWEEEKPWLWNLSWGVLAREEGTFSFDKRGIVIDQFLVNKPMALDEAPIRALPESVAVESGLPELAETELGITRPIPFGGLRKDEDKPAQVNEDGFSDHFPISVCVVEDD